MIVRTTVSSNNDKMIFKLGMHMMMTSESERYKLEVIYDI